MDLKTWRNWMLGEGLAITTIENRIRYLKRLDIDIDDIEEDDYYSLAEWLHDQAVSDASKNNFVRAINLYLKFRHISYRLKMKPLRGDPDIWIPTQEEADMIRRAVWSNAFYTARNQLMMKVLFMSALRRDECRRLKWSEIRVTPSKKYKGVYFHYIHIIGKNNRQRSVDIPKGLYNDLMGYKRYYAERSQYVFSNLDKPFSTNHVGRICKEAGEYAGAPRFHAHAARHYRSVELYLAGVDIVAIQRFLGHVKIETTIRYLAGYRGMARDQIIDKDAHFRELRKIIEHAKNAANKPNDEIHEGGRFSEDIRLAKRA